MSPLKNWWIAFLKGEQNMDNWWKRKVALCNDRKAEIVKINGTGQIFHQIKYDNKSTVHYLLYLAFLIKQEELTYLEEYVTPYRFDFLDEKMMNHKEIKRQVQSNKSPSLKPDASRREVEERFTYDRRAAVQYAEHWWNSYNPTYKRFTDDCTNYISQCLFAGGAPMRGAPAREDGWWYEGKDWSYSWALAHSLRWYLGGSTIGLYGREKQQPEDLSLGDVICYDFQGDGRWDHTTVVVAKDENNMPLVNAHTDNSRNRYWSYEDSTAWTPNIKYKFFQIGE